MSTAESHVLSGFSELSSMATLEIVILTAILAATVSGASNHKHVAGGKLEVKECYFLIAPETKMQRDRHIRFAGEFSIPVGNVICVDGVDRSNDQLWYKVRVMKMGTLDRSKHIPGWIDSKQMMEQGVWLSY